MGEEQERAGKGPSSPVDGLMTPQDYAAAIRAELDRLEALARAATPGPWRYTDDILDRESGAMLTANVTVNAWDVACCYGGPMPGTAAERERLGQLNAAHIAAHDPQRLLARIADDRQRVERDLATLNDHQWDGGMCGRCMWGKDPCPDTSRALASLRGLYEALGLTDA